MRGEGDHGPGGNAAWVRRWGEPWFSRAFRGFQVLGLDTALTPGAGGPVFEIGAAQRRWLARELARLSPATPLIILSHAPLARLFHPWQQWTGDAPEVVRRLGQFSRVLCLHGHVHGAGASEPGWGLDEKIPPIPPLEKGGKVAGLFGEAGVRAASPPLPKGDLGDFQGPGLIYTDFESCESAGHENHVSLPATAWPRPLAIQGTPATPRPGRGPRGCGWALVTLSAATRRFQPYLWQA